MTCWACRQRAYWFLTLAHLTPNLIGWLLSLNQIWLEILEIIQKIKNYFLTWCSSICFDTATSELHSACLKWSIVANSGKNFKTSATVIIPFASSNINAVFDASRWIMYSAILSQRYLSCDGEVELSAVAALITRLQSLSLPVCKAVSIASSQRFNNSSK